MNDHSLSTPASHWYRRWRRGGTQGENPPGRAWRLALIVWLGLAVAVSVRTLMRPSSHTVFPIFSTAAAHWWSDQALYQDDPSLDNFRYPPVFTLFVTPFAAFGLRAGGILWSWTSMAIYVAGLVWFVHEVIPSQWTRQRTALFLMLAALGALRGLWNAQSNALMVGLLLMGTAALARATAGRQPRGRLCWIAALLLAAPVCLKLTPLAPVLLLAALWPRQLMGRLLVVSAVFFLLPFLSRPPAVVLAHYHEWFDHLLETGGSRWLGFRDGWTIWVVLRHLFGAAPSGISLRDPIDSSWYRSVQLATAVVTLLWCLWQQRRAVRLGLEPRWLIFVTLSMGLAWLMLFGPAVEHATYVFLAPPLIWALLERRAWPLGQGLIRASFALVMFLGWGAVSRLLPTWPVLLIALPAGTALFMLWLVGYAGASGARSGASSQMLSEARAPIAVPLMACVERGNEAAIQS